jgi:hypothetical protein
MIALHFLRWALRLIRDIVWSGVANRAPALSLGLLMLLLVGVVAIGAKISAPFIYTLF